MSDRIFTSGNNGIQYYIESKKGRCNLCRLVTIADNINRMYFFKTKEYNNYDCNTRTITRKSKLDDSVLFINKTSKDVDIFTLVLHDNKPNYDELKISGNYNAGKPSEVVIKMCKDGKERYLNEQNKVCVLLGLKDSLNDFSAMTRKLLIKSIAYAQEIQLPKLFKKV